METIKVTRKAAWWVSEQLSNRGRGYGIRIGVKNSGCTGYKYLVEYCDTPDDHDIIIDVEGVKLVVDPKSMIILSGMTVDFKTEGLNSGLDFKNPNVTGECGCGESFSVNT